MRRRLPIIVAIVALVMGAALIAYPYISNALWQAHMGEQLQEYDETVSAMSDSEIEAARDEALRYNEELLDSRTVVVDPFDPSKAHLPSIEYSRVLDVSDNGVMAQLAIPCIGANLPVYHGTTDEVLQKGVGHLEQTSLPIGGESSHCVLSGHTGLPSIRIFDALDKVEVGDYFVLQVLGEDHAYRVYAIETVLPEETQSLVIQPGRDLTTLVTCTPYGINTHRLLVHGERCPLPDEWLASDGSAGTGWAFGIGTLVIASIVGAAAAAAIVAAVLITRRRKR